jgi:serine phosphatase RsbU (regulator of sigma subunit)
MESEPGRLLVVDDVEANRDLLARRLTKLGHEVAVAVNGREALEKIARESYDLVLLDVMMPELDGYQVLERLRDDGSLWRLPVIMISAVDETASVVRCIEMGATDYLTKPFNSVLLKARVSATLERKRLRDRERLHARSLERELEIGREIQMSFLPDSLPQPAGWEIAASFHPARQVAGDFYDAFSLPDGRIGLVIADVCDKGVGAALYMALFRTLIRAGAEAGASANGASMTSSLIARVNDYIATTHGRANMFATIFFAVLDPVSGRVAFVNAGHEPAAVMAPAGVRARLAPTGPAAGLLPERQFRTAETVVEKGETLLAFTDGVTEARGPDGQLFGQERLLRLLAEPSPSAAARLARIADAIRAHAAGADPSDDLTLLAAWRLP